VTFQELAAGTGPGSVSGLFLFLTFYLQTAIVTLDKSDFAYEIGQLPASLMHDVDRGLRRVIGM
jgi:hypothetical protein